MSSSLLLTDSILGLNSYPNRLVVLCHKCGSENRIAIHSEEVEDKVALASIHTGIGHSHIEDAVLASLVYQASDTEVLKTENAK